MKTIIGTNREMQASTRVIPCCYIIGQAVGAAASVCVDSKTSAINAEINEIKKIIAEL